jgi:molybdate transport system substrate-binding protein
MDTKRKLLIGGGMAAGVALAVFGAQKFSTRAKESARPLTVFCAAGIKPPVEEIAREYERMYRVPIQLQYGGSGTLLGTLRVRSKGDLFLAADQSYLLMARTNQLVQEIIPLAHISPVLAVPKGNPKQLRSVRDLLRPDVAVALANPEAAAVGEVTRRALQAVGQWEAIQRRVKVFKPTVNDIANDVRIGTVDVGIVWDATVSQYPDLEAITVPELSAGSQHISVGVLASSAEPARALHFARYLGARDRGQRAFARLGYRAVDGDVWQEVPEVILFSGAVNRVAIEETLERFQRREGVKISRVYNGCGILVAQMKAGQRPDAYIACDVSFMGQVADLFLDSTNLAQTQMVILVPRGNPKAIKSLSDLARPGLRLGLANAQQSALGALTQRLLASVKLEAPVMANVKTETPTADLLVNQLRTGSLDAVIVYAANTSQVRDQLEIIPIDHPAARAIQPFAIARRTDHPFLMARLLSALRSTDSRRCFETSGFDWLADKPNP